MRTRQEAKILKPFHRLKNSIKAVLLYFHGNYFKCRFPEAIRLNFLPYPALFPGLWPGSYHTDGHHFVATLKPVCLSCASKIMSTTRTSSFKALRGPEAVNTVKPVCNVSAQSELSQTLVLINF